MDKVAAYEMIEVLAKEFGMKTPKLLWNDSGTRAWAMAAKNQIYIGAKSHMGVEATVVHEFAHLLYRHRIGAKRGRAHAEGFCFALLRTAQAWYGDATKYRWDLEYRTVKKWWERYSSSFSPAPAMMTGLKPSLVK